MDYKEKYEMALERARIWKDKSGMPKDKQGILDDIFPELKESEDEKIRKELITHCRNTRCVTEEGAERIVKWIAWLEKQGENPQGKSALEAINEQKPNNKPKFNVGDWICNSACIVHIASIKNGMYYFDEGDSHDIAFVDNNYHLWTIQDAKDGDVLVDVYGNIGIFEEHDAFDWLAYCSLGCNGGFQNFKVEHENDKIHPATKEQCDTLMKAMADAGWEFDFDKKELKKIENEHICELDNSYTCVKFPFKAKVKSSGTIVTIHNGQLSSDGKEWIKYQSGAEDGYKIYEPNNLELVCEIKQKHAWSEEDENNLTDTCVAIRKFYHGINGAQELIDWLQSLKERFTWKPSDKQIIALRWVLNNIPYNTHKEEISGLLDQIKDL